jgi:hypothetical protein
MNILAMTTPVVFYAFAVALAASPTGVQPLSWSRSKLYRTPDEVPSHLFYAANIHTNGRRASSDRLGDGIPSLDLPVQSWFLRRAETITEGSACGD